jgi:adenylyl-sulfate kinase
VAEQSNLFTQSTKVTRTQRESLASQRACVIWFTGLSGSGKSALAAGLERILFEKGHLTYLLDGDNIRQGLNKDLAFDAAGRAENIRRLSEVAALMVDAGLVVLTAFISPFRADREMARRTVGAERFIEVFVDCPIEVCEQRDVKGLYKKARAGEVANFTGINSPYEVPLHPDVVIKTAESSLDDSLALLVQKIAVSVKGS